MLESCTEKKGKFKSNTTRATTTFCVDAFPQKLLFVYTYTERVRERESIDTNNTNVRVTSTNKLLGMDQILPSVR